MNLKERIDRMNEFFNDTKHDGDTPELLLHAKVNILLVNQLAIMEALEDLYEHEITKEREHSTK